MKCGVWNQMKIWSSHLLDNLSNCLMNLKNSGDSTGFEPMTSAMPVQCSNQLRYAHYIPFTGKHEPNKLTCSELCDFIAQLVRALHRHRRGTVAHKGKTQLNIELDTQRFFVIQNNFTRCTTIFRDAKQFFTVHNNFSWYRTILQGAQQFFVMQNNFSRCTTSFRGTKQFFTVHNKLSWCRGCLRRTEQRFTMQN